ncbi:MAG TPA: response regulator [Terriglobales bacterium]|nr:response regulator [Terriglobales bacterium]
MKQKILLVDNNHEYRHVMATIVRRAGYEVIQTDKAPKAVERALSEHPDVIMMDPAMLAMDDGGISTWIKNNLSPLGIPVFIYSAREAGSWNDALSSGATEVLTKPVPFTDLRDILRKHLSSTRNRPRPIPSPSFDLP